jgi:pimeloyl-ACP methyl ester carboxylesterase
MTLKPFIVPVACALMAGASTANAQSAEPATLDPAAIREYDHYVPVEPGVQIHVKEKIATNVEAQGRPVTAVVLLHSAGIDYRAWDVPVKDYSLMNVLAAHGFDVFALDRRGFGLSTRPPDGKSIDTDLSSNDTIRVIEYVRSLRHHVDRVSVLGESAGSWEAVMVATKRPDLIDRVVLNGAFFFGMAQPSREIFSQEFFLGAPNGYAAYVPALFPAFIPSAEQAVLDWLMSYYNGSDTFAVGMFLECWRLPVNHDLENFDKPVLIIDGTRDIFEDKSDILHFMDRISSAKITFVQQDGVGHGPFLEKDYKEFQRLAIEFLSVRD